MDKTPANPHPIALIVWSFWWLGVLYYLAVVQTQPLAALAWVGGFFPFEAVLYFVSPRNTLSGVVTWTVRLLSKHTRVGRGWNNLVTVIVLPIALLVEEISRALVVGPAGVALGVGLALALFIGLHDHWLNPEDHG
jgi:hypothetical protein